MLMKDWDRNDNAISTVDGIILYPSPSCRVVAEEGKISTDLLDDDLEGGSDLHGFSHLVNPDPCAACTICSATYAKKECFDTCFRFRLSLSSRSVLSTSRSCLDFLEVAAISDWPAHLDFLRSRLTML